MLLGVAKFGGVLASMGIVDRYPRRRILVIGEPVCVHVSFWNVVIFVLRFPRHVLSNGVADSHGALVQVRGHRIVHSNGRDCRDSWVHIRVGHQLGPAHVGGCLRSLALSSETC